MAEAFNYDQGTSGGTVKVPLGDYFDSLYQRGIRPDSREFYTAIDHAAGEGSNKHLPTQEYLAEHPLYPLFNPQIMKQHEQLATRQEKRSEEYSQYVLHRALEEASKAKLGSLISPSQAEQIPQVPNLALPQGAASQVNTIRPPMQMNMPITGGNSPFGNQYQLGAPPMEASPSVPQTQLTPTPSPQNVGLTGPIQAPTPAQPGRFMGTPQSDETINALQQVANARIDPNHIFTAAVSNQIMSPDAKRLFGLEGAGAITKQEGERYAALQEKHIEARSPFGKALEDYQKLPVGPLKDMAYQNIMKESAQVVGTPEYNTNLKVMNVQPGHETPKQALDALNAVDTRKYANERFLQALKAGDETMNIIAARMGKEKGIKQATFSDLSVEDQAKATDEWMNKKGYLSSIQGAGSAAAHENVKRVAALAPAQVIMDALDKQIGTLFTAGGSLDRAIQTPGMNLGVWTQKNPDAVLYQSLSQGFLAKLARAAGEVGVLTEQDVARAEKLLPKLLPVPDTREVAAGKMKQLRAMLDEISSRQVSVEGLPTMGATITHGNRTTKQNDVGKMSDQELLDILQGKGKK